MRKHRREAIEEWRAEEKEVFEKRPWHQLEDESDIAHQAFAKYLTMKKSWSDRQGRLVRIKADLASELAAAGLPGGLKQQLNKWVQRFKWDERADAYDEFMRSPDGIEEAENRRTYGQKLRTLSTRLLDLAIDRANNLQPEEIAAQDITKVLKLAMDAGDRAEQLGAPETDKVRDEYIRNIQAELAELGAAEADLGAVETDDDILPGVAGDDGAGADESGPRYTPLKEG